MGNKMIDKVLAWNEKHGWLVSLTVYLAVGIEEWIRGNGFISFLGWFLAANSVWSEHMSAQERARLTKHIETMDRRLAETRKEGRSER